MDQPIKPTDWSQITQESFRQVPVDPEEGSPWYAYTSVHIELCQRIAEPVALQLAAQNDWPDLDDIKNLTGMLMTTPVAVQQLLEKLHPQHPTFRPDDHDLRIAAARQNLPSEWQRGLPSDIPDGFLSRPRSQKWAR